MIHPPEAVTPARVEGEEPAGVAFDVMGGRRMHHASTGAVDRGAGAGTEESQARASAVSRK